MKLSEHALAAEAARIPDMPYLGVSLLLAWHYCLWFVPSSTASLGLLSDQVTKTWLVTLACTGIFALAGAALAGRMKFAMGKMAAAGAAFGISNAVLILAWAERYTAIRASFSMKTVALSFAGALFASMLATFFTPSFVSATITALLPLASFAVYRRNEKEVEGKEAPVPLPRESRASMMRCVKTLCVTTVLLEFMLSFVCGITPHELRGIGQDGTLLPWNTAVGIIIGSALLAAASRSKRADVYALIPFLVAFGIVALCLSVQGAAICSLAAFAICIGTCMMLEVLLMAFFGTLASKGYLASALSFALAMGLPRLSTALGDGCGIALRETWQDGIGLVSTVCLAFVCVLAFLLIAILHQERTIAFLTSDAPQADDTERVCESAAQDFGLSPRETEILKLIARGHAVDAVAKKLVVSPYTVQTHIQHIYRKMQVHKRSELMDYLNLHRDEN